MGIISGLGSFRGQFGDHFRVGDHFGVGIISGAVQHSRPQSLRFFWSRGRRNGILGLRTSGSGDENGRERCKGLIALNLFLCISTQLCWSSFCYEVQNYF